MLSILTQYANFKGRCARKPFWLFISITHLLLMLLYSPALYLGMLWVTEQTSNPEYNDIFQDIAACVSDTNNIDLSSPRPQISQQEAQAIMEDITPIITERLLPLLQDNASNFIAHIPQNYPWHFTLTLLALLSTIILIIPSNAITICRLRDAGFHPACLLLLYIGILPLPLMQELGLLGQIALFILLCFPSKQTATPTQNITPIP